MKEYELQVVASHHQQQEETDKRLKYESSPELINTIDDFTYFDYLLTSEWKRAMKNGVFKFKIDGPLPTRYLNGKYSFLVQLNPKRYSEKRPSEIKPTTRVNQEFDRSRFNFSRINENEILFELKNEQDKVCFISRNGQKYPKSPTSTNHEDETATYIIINNSPIEFGHSLIVPRIKSGLNQVLNDDAIQLAVRISLLSRSVHLIVGFNSINAYASVNHLHLHAYYMNSQTHEKKFPFPIQNVMHAEHIGNSLWFINQDHYYLPAFSLQLCDFNDIQEFSKHIFHITNYLSTNEIPHNFILVKADAFKSSLKKTTCSRTRPSDNWTLRAVIWPKKPAYEVPQNQKSIAFAMSELSGHFLLFNENDYESLNENDILELATNMRLDTDTLTRIKEDVVNIFEQKY